MVKLSAAKTDLPSVFISLLLKDIEHRKLGWKVLILKYDLGKKS